MESLPHEKQIQEYVNTIEHLKKQNQDNPLFHTEIKRLEDKLEQLKKKVYSELTAWERVLIARHPSRPNTIDYIRHICDPFHELCGDRTYRDDRSVVGGLAKIGGHHCLVIGQEKGHDTDSRVDRNFGMLHPEGFRKALRLMKLAEKFHLPVISLIDTPGAFPGLEAEERGQGWAIAHNLKEMAMIRTPLIVLLIGEASSGGALGIAAGDVIGMLQHAYYTVISPEGCASILWKDAGKKVEAASALKLNAENLFEYKIVDTIIEEPLGGAHHDPEAIFEKVKLFIIEQINTFKHIHPDLLLEQRYEKYRQMGRFVEMTERQRQSYYNDQDQDAENKKQRRFSASDA